MGQHKDKSQPLLVDLEESMVAVQSIFFSVQHSNQTSAGSATAQRTLSSPPRYSRHNSESYAHTEGCKEAPLCGPTSDFKEVPRHRDADQLPAEGDAVKSQAKPQLLIAHQYTNQYANNLVAFSRPFERANNMVFSCCCKAAQLPR